MATLLLAAVGTLAAGPIGGALGALAGRQIDRAIIGSPHREGPRLDELSVTTSSYGTPIPRHHGHMRAPGSVIWATDLVERSEKRDGVTLYRYSVSFAVALSSRPILDVGRIWADGSLLRGEAGDLKAGGTLHIHRGHGDQPVDPLIASDKGAACPAFRHTAYAVFEDLDLADFGNRIPSLSFELIADNGEVTLAEMLRPMAEPFLAERPLAGLQGFSVEGGPLSETLAALDAAWPMALDAGADRLAIRAADALPEEAPLLPEPASAAGEDEFGRADGRRHSRASPSAEIPVALRYFDTARDFRSGLQRAAGRPRPGAGTVIELPAALAAGDARALINAAAEQAGWALEGLAWRMAELDPTLAPGMIVRAPGHAGLWRIASWEWRDHGVELELQRLPRGPARQPPADAGSFLPPPDLVASPTMLEAFELPWDGAGASDRPAQFAAASSESAGWRGAALYADHGGELIALGSSGARRCIIGHTWGEVPPSPAMRLEARSAIEIDLLSEDFVLTGTGIAGLANGANRALLGGEIIQFASAASLGSGRWRIEGLLRGRDGTEQAALAGHAAGTPFVLLDGTPARLNPAQVGFSHDVSIAAIGAGDAAPVNAAIANPGLTLRPPAPVHPRAAHGADGSLSLRWTRRARGARGWPDEVDVPLAEQAESYRVGIGPVNSPFAIWQVGQPALLIDGDAVSALRIAHPGADVWVRQIGSSAQSDPLFLATLS